MQHYTKNTTGILRFCPMCNKKTMHRVDSGRVGPCENSHIKQTFKETKKINKTGSLF
jgi:ribosomal protein L44E